MFGSNCGLKTLIKKFFFYVHILFILLLFLGDIRHILNTLKIRQLSSFLFSPFFFCPFSSPSSSYVVFLRLLTMPAVLLLPLQSFFLFSSLSHSFSPVSFRFPLFFFFIIQFWLQLAVRGTEHPMLCFAFVWPAVQGRATVTVPSRWIPGSPVCFLSRPVLPLFVMSNFLHSVRYQA